VDDGPVAQHVELVGFPVGGDFDQVIPDIDRGQVGEAGDIDIGDRVRQHLDRAGQGETVQQQPEVRPCLVDCQPPDVRHVRDQDAVVIEQRVHGVARALLGQRHELVAPVADHGVDPGHLRGEVRLAPGRPHGEDLSGDPVPELEMRGAVLQRGHQRVFLDDQAGGLGFRAAARLVTARAAAGLVTICAACTAAGILGSAAPGSGQRGDLHVVHGPREVPAAAADPEADQAGRSWQGLPARAHPLERREDVSLQRYPGEGRHQQVIAQGRRSIMRGQKAE